MVSRDTTIPRHQEVNPGRDEQRRGWQMLRPRRPVTLWGWLITAASRTGHPGTVRDMLASGANVNVRDEHGNTALIEAARNGHDDVVRTLLGAGADVKAKNDEEKTALMLAAQGGQEETARLLRQSGTVERVPEDVRAPLTVAS